MKNLINNIDFNMAFNEWLIYATFVFISIIVGACFRVGTERKYNIFFIGLLIVETFLFKLILGNNLVFVLPLVSILVQLSTQFTKPDINEKNDKYLQLESIKGNVIKYYYYYSNFLVYGGAGSGKTKSIGKPLMEQYLKEGFAAFIYDFKDFDYTKTAYSLVKKHHLKNRFFYVNFDNISKSHRFNPLSPNIVKDNTVFLQLIKDILLAMLPPKSQEDEWFKGALGIFQGVAIRFYYDYPTKCTLPHIIKFILMANTEQLMHFLRGTQESAMLAGAYMKAEGSERTQASFLSTLCNYLSLLATNKNICYVLSGNDFDFNLIDPEDPKIFCISNNYKIESVISPVIAMLMSIASRSFTMGNKVPFVFVLDEMTTFKVSDFEKLPSVLREYKAAFILLTQSGAKIEKLYSKLDRSSIEANFGNVFFGSTKDVEALKYYPMFFGKYEAEKKSKSSGHGGGGHNSSVTISTQKEDVFQSTDFAKLEPGEFIGMGSSSNIKGYFKHKFKMFKLEEEELPDVRLVTEKDLSNNNDMLENDITEIFNEMSS